VVVTADAILGGFNRETIAVIQKIIVQQFKLLPRQQSNELLNTQIVHSIEDNYDAVLTSELDGFELVAIKDNHSNRLYFHCKGFVSLFALRRLFDTGQLRNAVESFFNAILFPHQNLTPVFVKYLYLLDYCNCADYFHEGITAFLDRFDVKI